MQNIWGSRTESGLNADEFRDEVALHLMRNLGEPHTAFSDQDGWAGKSKEPGPPIDVLVVPPEGERRFAYVCTMGCALKRNGDKTRMEFVMAAPQTGEAKEDLARLNLAANTVRQFAKLVHIQPVRVTPGETVQFSANPKPMFEGSKQLGFAFATPRLPNDSFQAMKLQGGEAVTFVAPIPIYRSELQYGRTKGPRALNKALTKAGVTEMLDIHRKPVKRSFLGMLASLFGQR
jgi:hypothetical protein